MAWEPRVLSVRMSDYGYWIADVSTGPGKTVSVMIAVTGIERDSIPQVALTALTGPIRGISP